MTNPTQDLSPHAESANRRKLRQRVGSGLLGMGVLHLVVRKPFEKIVPRALGAPAFWNLVAAAAEATAGGLLLTRDPKKQQIGGKLATATIVGVYPANIEMAVRAGAPTNLAAITAWARLPLQIPMIHSAWALARPET